LAKGKIPMTSEAKWKSHHTKGQNLRRQDLAAH